MLTELEQRIACAELQNWRLSGQYEGRCIVYMPNGISLGIFDSESLAVEALPDYPNDLNAMHEVELTLTDDEVSEHFHNLNACINPHARTIRQSFEIFCASADRRLASYLKLKGKWID